MWIFSVQKTHTQTCKQANKQQKTKQTCKHTNKTSAYLLTGVRTDDDMEAPTGRQAASGDGTQGRSSRKKNSQGRHQDQGYFRLLHSFLLSAGPCFCCFWTWSVCLGTYQLHNWLRDTVWKRARLIINTSF